MQPSQDDTSPEESIHGGSSIPDWQARDWEDEEYTPPDRDCGAGSSDPMAALLDGLPGFITEDIDAVLRDLPLPDAGDVPGMTVEEAIQVLYNILYSMLYMLCTLL